MPMNLSDYWSSFREELIATSLVLVVATGGSFFIINKMVNGTADQPKNEDLTNQVLGIETAPTLPATLTPPPPPSITVMPSGNPFISELTYGTGGLYETDQYKLGISNPRIVFDAREMASRKFVVDLTLSNKAIPGGLSNALSAAIVKDGVVIVPEAAVSVSEAKVLMPAETVAYQGRLSLIEGTDVSLIRFSPSGLPPIEHVLRP